MRTTDLVVDGDRLTLSDYGTLPSPDDFLVFAPQWDFLNFLAHEGAALPGFELLMSTEATGVIFDDDDTVRGILATGREAAVEIRATLTVAADGRGSRIRDAVGFVPEELGVPIDVLWFDLPKPPEPPPPTLGYLDGRGMVLTLDRGDRYQGGLVIRKGEFDDLRAAGIDRLRDTIAEIAPVLAPVVGSPCDFDQVKLLSVQINRLGRWHRGGFIAIGDAAHAMSPVGGVGVNYAIQDAVALANAVTTELSKGRVSSATLEHVQRRRMAPVRTMQFIQRLVHGRIVRTAPRPRALPRPARALLRLAARVLRRVMARIIGLGFRPEHVAKR